MMQLAVVVISFVLTGIVGNRLVQRWQLNSWRRQQNFLGHEKEYILLRDLAERLSDAMGKRLFHMKRLLAAVVSFDLPKLEERLQKYDLEVVSWNENINSFHVKLTMYAGYQYVSRMEGTIQSQFSAAGSRLEHMVRCRRERKKADSAEIALVSEILTHLQHTIFEYNRDILRNLEISRKEIFFGRDIHYDRNGIESYSTWELIKALFIRDVDRHSVRSTTLDARHPD